MIGAVQTFRTTLASSAPRTFPDSRSVRDFTPVDFQAVLTPFPAAHPQNSPVTPFAATHTNSPSRKSFPCHTYEKQGVSPVAQPILAVAVGDSITPFLFLLHHLTSQEPLK